MRDASNKYDPQGAIVLHQAEIEHKPPHIYAVLMQ